MNTKIIALFLPQFHTIPENEKWWGKGFTEWTNVRKARSLFRGHEQPRVPLDDNYYDLSNVSTLRNQAKLAKEYGVYGFCFYHYWFAGGKMLLEKPAEMLLENTDINMPFCFSWANEPWTRTWDGKAHQVLMSQNYGGEEDWRKHFNYLLPFFKDERYIKENNSPMFVIYKPHSIKCAKEMMELWNELAVEAGFSGIHFVETLRGGGVDRRKLPFKAHMEFEPVRTNFHQSWAVLNYKRVRRRVLKLINAVFHTSIMLNKPFEFAEVALRSLALESPEHTYGGVFVGWDNTARRGVASTIVMPPTKEEFKSYLRKKAQQTEEEYHENYVFINAWNEWCEGAYLEPDTVHRYAYLEAIKELKNE
jgi:lipopolysaccharide biosynthesis protein